MRFKQVVPGGELKGLWIQHKHRKILFWMGLFPSAAGSSHNAADVYAIQQSWWQLVPHHAGCAPYVGWRAVPSTDEHFQ